MTSPFLPQEVFHEIISQLTDETTLKSCSLVCRSFRRNAQKILFRSIYVALLNNNDYNESENFVLVIFDYNESVYKSADLVSTIDGAPHLIEYIQNLKINGNSILVPTDDDYDPDLADALDIFSHKGEFPINLRSLYLESLSDWWHYMTPRLQDALVLLMKAVPSLRDITLHGCPAKLVQNLPPFLKHLTLKNTTFPSLPTTRNELPKLESLKILGIGFSEFLDAVERIVDMTQLKTFNAEVDENSMPLIEQILRPTSNSLEHIILKFDIFDPDSVPIDLNRFSHLTDITIGLFYHGNRLSRINPVLIFITKTMEKISHRNVIQNLSFCLYHVGMVDDGSVTKDIWQELDTICFIPQLTLSNSFRGITFIIKSPTLNFNCDAFSDLVQNKLPETKKANKLHVWKEGWDGLRKKVELE